MHYTRRWSPIMCNNGASLIFISKVLFSSWNVKFSLDISTIFLICFCFNMLQSHRSYFISYIYLLVLAVSVLAESTVILISAFKTQKLISKANFNILPLSEGRIQSLAGLYLCVLETGRECLEVFWVSDLPSWGSPCTGEAGRPGAGSLDSLLLPQVLMKPAERNNVTLWLQLRLQHTQGYTAVRRQTNTQLDWKEETVSMFLKSNQIN